MEDIELESLDFKHQKKTLRTYKKKKFEHDKLRGRLAQPGPNPFIMVLDNLKTTFNIGKIYRSAYAFGGKEMHLLGTEYFDPLPAKGSLKHIPTKFMKTFDDSYRQLKSEGYTIYLLDPAKGSELHKTTFDEKSAFVMGHEQYGIQFPVEQYTDLKFIKISQFGRVESLNVSIAASIVMYEYLRQLKLK